LIRDQVFDLEIVEERDSNRANEKKIVRHQKPNTDIVSLKQRNTSYYINKPVCIKANRRSTGSLRNAKAHKSQTISLTEALKQQILLNNSQTCSLFDNSDNSDSYSSEHLATSENTWQSSTYSSKFTNTLSFKSRSAARKSQIKVMKNAKRSSIRHPLIYRSFQASDASIHKAVSTIYVGTSKSTLMQNFEKQISNPVLEKVGEHRTTASSYGDLFGSSGLTLTYYDTGTIPQSSMASLSADLSDTDGTCTKYEHERCADVVEATIWRRAKRVLMAMEEFRDVFKRLNFIKITACEAHICDICLAEILDGKTAFWEPDVLSCLTLLKGITICCECFNENVTAMGSFAGFDVETQSCPVCNDLFTVSVELVNEEHEMRTFCSKCENNTPSCFYFTLEEAKSWWMREVETQMRGLVADVPKLDDSGQNILIAFWICQVQAPVCKSRKSLAYAHQYHITDFESDGKQINKYLDRGFERADESDQLESSTPYSYGKVGLSEKNSTESNTENGGATSSAIVFYERSDFDSDPLRSTSVLRVF